MEKRIKSLVAMLIAMGVCLTSCKKGFELNESSVTLNKGDKYTIGYENGTNLVYTSNNPYVATVDAEGVVTANFVGVADINVAASEGEQNLRVNVAPLYTFYEEPCLDFSLSKSEIHAKYADYYFGYSYQGDKEMRFYQMAGKKYSYGYLYDAGQLAYTYVWVRSSTLKEMQDYLGERYYNEGGASFEGQYVYMYSNRTDLMVGLFKYENHPDFGYGYVVMYFSIDLSNMASSRSAVLLDADFAKWKRQ